MHISVEPRSNHTILHLRGEFDTFYCTLLQKEIDQLIAAGSVHVALNLRLVKFINSTALGAIIKASKALAARGGKLVILRPSSFCRDIIEKVGIDRVVPIYNTDEEAAAGLTRAAQARAPGAAQAEPETDDATAVLFAPTDEARIEHFVPEDQRRAKANPVHGHSFGSKWTGVGRMSALDKDGLRFTWSGGSTGLTSFEMGQFLSIGTELKVKFSLSLLQKGFCEAVVAVTEVEERADGVKIGTTFSSIDDATRAAVKQYSEDLAFLKKELRQATQG